jgi:hypothetical protein
MESTLTPDPWRHERQLIKFGSIAIVFLGSLGFPFLARDSYTWFPTFALWAGWLVVLPAWAIARRFGPTATPLERAGFGGTLALVGLALFQLVSLELGSRWLVLGYPFVTLLAMFLMKSRGTPSPRVDVEPMPRGVAKLSGIVFRDPTPQPPPRNGEGEKYQQNPLRFGEGGERSEPGGVPETIVEPMPRSAMLGGIVAFTMALGVMAALPTFFSVKAPVLDEHRKSRWLKLLPDILLHLQAQEEMSHTWPPQFSPAAGVPLRYHLAADALTMALTPPGVHRIAVNCRYMPALWHLMVAVNGLLLARRYLGATWLAGLFPILAVFGEDAGWLVPKFEIQMVPSLPTFPSFFWYNPNLPGLAVLLGGLGALGLASTSKDVRSVAAAVILMGGAALFKVFIGLQAGLAVAFAILFVAPDARRVLLKVIIGLGLFALLLAFVYRHTFEAPNQHIKLEVLAEMRMSYWFIPVILGFRIFGLGEIIRIPRWARSEGPLRVVVVGLAITGFLGLFVRISAELLPGVLGYNNGVWLAVVAKVPMWLLVLGAIQRWPLGRAGKVALALLVTFIAVRGAWPFVAFQRNEPEVATPPHLITPEDMEVPAWLERSTPAGTIVACDRSFPLSLTALSPYRTPCPQGGEFAYAISFMTSQDYAMRLTDTDQFWGEWSCGGLPREYLEKYGVRWIITRADLGCPDGIRQVFRNGSWAIYEAIPLNSVELAER